jgi:hypothetical protein
VCELVLERVTKVETRETKGVARAIRRDKHSIVVNGKGRLGKGLLYLGGRLRMLPEQAFCGGWFALIN